MISRPRQFKVVFCGTPDFCLPSLEILHFHPMVNLLKVISQPSRPAGRGQQIHDPAVIEFARHKNISFHQTENINLDHKLLEELAQLDLDMIIVLAFSQFLGKKILDLPHLGCFNIHGSLLPKYRGAAPIHYALLQGDLVTGISIQKMVKKMDAGDIVTEEQILIGKNDNFELLYTRLKFQAALCLSNFIEQASLQQLHFRQQQQNEALITYAPTLKKEDGHLHFAEDKKENIINKIKALNPWPTTYCFLNGKRLKVFSANEVDDQLLQLKPGQVHISSGQLIIGCMNGSLRLTSLQLEGKKICSDEELLRGLQNNTHTIIIN